MVAVEYPIVQLRFLSGLDGCLPGAYVSSAVVGPGYEHPGDASVAASDDSEAGAEEGGDGWIAAAAIAPCKSNDLRIVPSNPCQR